MYNVIVYVWDLSNQHAVTVIEQGTRFFFQIVSVKSNIICMIKKQDIPISTLPVTNVCRGFLEYLPGPYISRYLQPEGGGGISKLQYFNCHSARIHCCPTSKTPFARLFAQKKVSDEI